MSDSSSVQSIGDIIAEVHPLGSPVTRGRDPSQSHFDGDPALEISQKSAPDHPITESMSSSHSADQSGPALAGSDDQHSALDQHSPQLHAAKRNDDGTLSLPPDIRESRSKLHRFVRGVVMPSAFLIGGVVGLFRPRRGGPAYWSAAKGAAAGDWVDRQYHDHGSPQGAHLQQALAQLNDGSYRYSAADQDRLSSLKDEQAGKLLHVPRGFGSTEVIGHADRQEIRKALTHFFAKTGNFDIAMAERAHLIDVARSGDGDALRSALDKTLGTESSPRLDHQGSAGVSDPERALSDAQSDLPDVKAHELTPQNFVADVKTGAFGGRVAAATIAEAEKLLQAEITDFIIAAEELRNLDPVEDEVMFKAKLVELRENFIDLDSPQEINIDGSTRTKLSELLSDESVNDMSPEDLKNFQDLEGKNIDRNVIRSLPKARDKRHAEFMMAPLDKAFSECMRFVRDTIHYEIIKRLPDDNDGMLPGSKPVEEVQQPLAPGSDGYQALLGNIGLGDALLNTHVKTTSGPKKLGQQLQAKMEGLLNADAKGASGDDLQLKVLTLFKNELSQAKVGNRQELEAFGHDVSGGLDQADAHAQIAEALQRCDALIDSLQVKAIPADPQPPIQEEVEHSEREDIPDDVASNPASEPDDDFFIDTLGGPENADGEDKAVVSDVRQSDEQDDTDQVSAVSYRRLEDDEEMPDDDTDSILDGMETLNENELSPKNLENDSTQPSEKIETKGLDEILDNDDDIDYADPVEENANPVEIETRGLDEILGNDDGVDDIDNANPFETDEHLGENDPLVKDIRIRNIGPSGLDETKMTEILDLIAPSSEMRNELNDQLADVSHQLRIISSLNDVSPPLNHMSKALSAADAALRYLSQVDKPDLESNADRVYVNLGQVARNLRLADQILRNNGFEAHADILEFEDLAQTLETARHEIAEMLADSITPQ